MPGATVRYLNVLKRMTDCPSTLKKFTKRVAKPMGLLEFTWFFSPKDFRWGVTESPA
jgi:hypothetical protein